MTDVWRSTKKWTCKYCDITINDDVPSRNQHERGFRHLNAKERHLRSIYKAGAEQKRAGELERREMDRIDRAAAIAHARDTGLPLPTFPSSSASASASATAAAAAGSSSSSSAAAAAGRKDDSVGQPGEWETIPALPPPSSDRQASATDDLSPPPAPEEDVHRALSRKRPKPAPTLADDDDDGPRSFKFKRKERSAYHGSIVDEEDLPVIRLKKRPEDEAPAVVGVGVKVEDEQGGGGGGGGGVEGFRRVAWGDRLAAAAATTTTTDDDDVAPPDEITPDGAGASGEVKIDPSLPLEEPAHAAAQAPPPPPPAAAATGGDGGGGGGLFKKRRGPPKGVGKRPAV